MPTPIKPLRKVSLVDEVVDALREEIVAGRIRPGETLRIEALARQFGISRTPIREAISKLEAQGIVVRRTGYSATVFAPRRREVLEYYEMRLVLEPLAARLVIENMTPAVERRLARLVEEMDDFTMSRWYGLNQAFHRQLYESSDRPFLVSTIDNLIQRSDPYIRMYFASHDLEETQRGHRRILAALADRDGHELGAAVEAHLGHVVTEIVAAISEDGEREPAG